MFIIEFQQQEDLQKVHKGKPWTFHCNLLCLNFFDGFSTPNDIRFNEETMWIQLHNIPFGGMTKEVGGQIGRKIGMVKEVDVDDDGIGCGRCGLP